MRAPEDRIADATRHCTLPAAFVENHPVLERVLSSATTAPRGEWVTAGTDRDVGETLADDLRAHCEYPVDLHHYSGDRFVVRVEENGEPILAGNSTRSEAIRGGQPTDRV